ncbi:MAG: lipoyl domain-containing protein [Ardenticatenaceae bacterium]|nr:lipoyl domain-containing protein [Ardenticatenaceae bacterium]HBY96698.1 hypothetical protein [Chloroflexota bacterium]
MATPIRMPQLGENVVEGTISRWLKAPGDRVAEYEPLLEVVSDKVDTEIPSPASGTLQQILVPAGETVAVGTVWPTWVRQARRFRQSSRPQRRPPGRRVGRAPPRRRRAPRDGAS